MQFSDNNTIHKTKKEPISILYLLETFPNRSSETFLLSEINELVRLGNSVHIVACNRDKAEHELLYKSNILNNVSYTYIFKNQFFKTQVFFYKFFKDLIFRFSWFIKQVPKICNGQYKLRSMIRIYLTLREVAHFRFDLIHLPFSQISFLEVANFLSTEFNCPFTVVFRALDLYKNTSEKLLKVKYKLALNAGKIITISIYNKEYIEKQIKARNEISVIHSAVDTEKFKPGMPAVEPKMLTVARFLEKKGIEYLLDAYKILSSRGVVFKAVIIGEGKRKKYYRQLIEEYNISDKVYVKQLMSQEDIYNELKTAMMFILPCVIAEDGDRDILPNVLKEAMSMEIPVITSDISGIEELIENNKNGLLVPSKDSQAIVDSILYLLSSKKLREKLGKNARKTIVSNFNLKKEANKLNDIFNYCLDKKQN